MERKISSSLTELNKVLSAVAFLAFIVFYSYLLLDYFNYTIGLFALLTAAIHGFFAYQLWRMKEVELTDAGLIISERFFFRQKHIFVPFEQIESVKNKFLWLGNTKQVFVKFTGETKFGEEICFMSKGLTMFSQRKMVRELNQKLLQQ